MKSEPDHTVSREAWLSRLQRGDLFHGQSPNGASLICLVTAVTPTHIRARRITTQDDVVFDRSIGADVGAPGVIDSTAPLPTHLHAVMMDLERKCRLYVKNGDMRLSEPEMRGLIALAAFYRAHPLPLD